MCAAWSLAAGSCVQFRMDWPRLVAHEIDHLNGVLYLARRPVDRSTITLAEYKGAGRQWQYGNQPGGTA
ncbi:MAG: Peptide deformylase [Streptosporangiaceae bacterium]|jgi:hypothetical protein|nr:Peptide deformylase [Streptosporangiaceae bacterium]